MNADPKRVIAVARFSSAEARGERLEASFDSLSYGVEESRAEAKAGGG